MHSLQEAYKQGSMYIYLSIQDNQFSWYYWAHEDEWGTQEP